MTTQSLIVAIMIFVVAFVYIYKQKTNTYSKLILYILFIISFIPSIVVYAFMPNSFRYLVLLCMYWVMLIAFINLFNRLSLKGKSFKIKPELNEKQKSLLPMYMVIIVELIVVLMVLRYTGINLDFDNVYILRDNYFDSKIPIILSYFYSACKVVNPLLFVYLLKNEKRVGYLCALIVQVLAFLGDGSKATILSILIAYLIVEYVTRKKTTISFFENDNIKYYILFGITGINFLAFVEYFLFGSSYLYNYFIRRLFFVPSLLNNYYFDYFSSHPYDFFRQSILGKIGFQSVYSMPIQNIIGSEYFSASTMLANNGLFSDAYMNMGVAGVFVLPLMLSLALRFLDYCAKRINPFYLITILVSVSYIFLSSSFFTVLLTHGYLLLCLILLFVVPKSKDGVEVT